MERERAERELRVVYQGLLEEAARHATLTAKERSNYVANPPQLAPAGTVGSAQAGAPRSLEKPLRLLLGMTVLVLLVAAGNVANLLTARGALRRHELAVTLALGARRWDLLRPKLVECIVLAGLSGCAALVLAAWTGSVIPTLLGVGNELAGVSTRPDARVVAFTAAVSVSVGLGIWLASALAVTRRRHLPLLAGSMPLVTWRRTGPGLRHLLVVVQLSLSLALVCTSAMLGRSLWNVVSTDPGFDADRLVGFSVNPGAIGYAGERLAVYVDTLAERAKAIPGVSRVALASARPLSGGGSLSRVDGPRQRAAATGGPFTEVVDVSPDYFATIGLPMVAGRAFDARDGTTTARVAIVNESLARLLLEGSSVVGEVIGFDNRTRCARPVADRSPPPTPPLCGEPNTMNDSSLAT